MANKIGPVDQNTIGKLGAKAGESVSENRGSSRSEAQAGARSHATKGDDTVALTGRAQLLERLEKSLDTLSPVDSTRVAEVRTAIMNGDYVLDSDAIANAMMRFERLLGD
ncbi:MAG TPA: flagellar biosynthesis anti-sigma factor FlgM [Woeseiaceae bacterium]|nr:flagellar biosynthesis anti-sigma factor FlgM [Woeseiaceae bacterium]